MSRFANLWDVAAACWRNLFTRPTDVDGDAEEHAGSHFPCLSPDDQEDRDLRRAISRQPSRE